MSTRALYTFKSINSDPYGQDWNVYKHHDCYPSGAAQVLRNALDYFAWPLPRFEADEAAAAFIAAGKAVYLIDLHRALKQKKSTTKARVFLEGEFAFHGGGVRLMPQGNPSEVARANCSDIEWRYELFMGLGGKKLLIRAIRGNWWHEGLEATRDEEVVFYGPFEDFEAVAKRLDAGEKFASADVRAIHAERKASAA